MNNPKLDPVKWETDHPRFTRANVQRFFSLLNRVDSAVMYLAMYEGICNKQTSELLALCRRFIDDVADVFLEGWGDD